MRTDLSEAFLSELARDGGKPAQYLLIKMPDNDRYLSDRPLEYAAGLYCEPLVADWGTLTDALCSSELIYDAVMPQREHRLSVLNAKQSGWFASLFTEELHQNTRVELWQGFEQTEPGQYVPPPVLIDEFVLQTPISLSSGGMTVDITLRQLLAAADPVIGPQDQAGGRYPVAVGGVLMKARLHGPQPVARLVADVVAGARTRSALSCLTAESSQWSAMRWSCLTAMSRSSCLTAGISRTSAIGWVSCVLADAGCCGAARGEFKTDDNK